MKSLNQVNAVQLYASPPHVHYVNLMMRFSILFFFLMFSAAQLFAQDKPKTQEPPPPLPTREISGIVKDSTDLGVIGATVSLTSDKDTLKTSTNSDGIFIFKNVKSATYTLVIQSIGYEKSKAMRFKQNDMVPRIVMDPIYLKEQKNTLNEVVIEGTPSITYKTDTVEYKASDYVVRKNATVDELLKKMEGMEVGTDGSLVHQGETVAKAKLNGKEYLGGDIANAIKNLPAEIVDKIQIVDDYGDQAARTGVKDGDPQKILNITTRTDKSVGNMLNMNAAGGSNERKEVGLFGTRINGNQQMGINGNYRDAINLNALSGSNKNTNARFSLRDKVGKKIEYNLNYQFTNSNGDNLNETESLSNISGRQLFSTNSSNSLQKSNNHQFKLELEAELDSSNYLKVIPSFTYNSSNNNSNSFVSQRANDISLGMDQDRSITNSNSRTAPEFGISAFYQHTFKKYRRNFSAQIDLNKNNQDNEQERYNLTTYYTQNDPNGLDSVLNQIIARKNLRDNYRGSVTYVEPLGTNTQFEVNAQVNYNGYDNTATTRNILQNGFSGVIDSLSNIYDYSFTQGRVALNFRYGMANTSKVRFSVGLTGVPALLSGTKISLGTTTRRSSFNLIPIARFEYRWSRQQKMSLNYSGSAVEPTFDQIQPVRDVTNPNNPIIGNPDLHATFVHTLRGEYNNYIANSKLNFSFNANGSYTENAVIRNVSRVANPGVPGTTINETTFLNVSGVYRLTGNYNISKQLDNRRYNLQLNGTVNYNHNLSMRDGILNTTNITSINHRFGPKINPTDWLEINADVGYKYDKSDNTTPNFPSSTIKTLSLNLDGRLYLWENWMLSYNGSKQFIDGVVGNTNNSPLVINASLERQLFNRRGQITFQAFDILNQNNFISYEQQAEGGYTNTRVNPVSRYFMLKLSMRLQKWSGAQGRGGRGIMRRGDGSFM